MLCSNIYRYASVHRVHLSSLVTAIPSSGSKRHSPFAFGRIMSSSKFAQGSFLNTFRLLITTCQLDRSSRGSEHVHQIDNTVCPQGIQGSDCATFELWLDNCRKFRLPNCEENIDALNAGEKTLSQVFAEQDELIHRIAEDLSSRRSSQLAGNVNTSPADLSSRQGVQPSFNGLQTPLLKTLLNAENPCPEGTQQSDCERFRDYLASCRQYKFSDCEQQLLDVQAGRKKIKDILQERDELLQAIFRYRDGQMRDTRDHVDQTGTTMTDSVGKTKTFMEEEADAKIDVSKLSQVQRLKRAMKEYGSVVIVFHVCISVISLGAFYAAVSSGIDMVGLIEKTGLMTEAFSARLLAGTSTFVVAYAIHKLFVPVRMAITLASTPFIVRHLRRIGFLKVPK